MKLVFLDFDGVLNSLAFQRSDRYASLDSPGRELCGIEDLDPDAAVHLHKILKKTEARIVVSSSWRKVRTLPELQDILVKLDFNRHQVIGVTPAFHDKNRGAEILSYIEGFRMIHDPIESFVILDDDEDMEPLMHRLVLTNWRRGLTEQHTTDAIRILNDPWEPEMEV